MTTLLKLGGELLEDATAMQIAATGIAALRAGGPVIVVHGGGRAIDAELRIRGVAPHFVDGLRVTDEATLATVVNVLAGRLNTSLVAALVAAGVPAIGLTGADGSIGLSDIASPMRTSAGTIVDLGLVGAPRADAPRQLLLDLISAGYVPVIASIGVTPDGSLVNVNADTLAAHLAVSAGADVLIVAGKTPGVLDADGTTCAALDQARATEMIADLTATAGMVAKLVACAEALDRGVSSVRIVDGRSGHYRDAPGTTLTRTAAQEFIQC